MTPENPYVGPRPFEREDADRFFGRERDARDLASMIVAHRVVLLYSASGAGKSSLVNAGVVPMLERKGFDLLPVARVGVLVAEPPANVFAGTLAVQLGAGDGSIAAALQARARGLDEEGEPIPRALVIDQFEELFTAHPEHWSHRSGLFVGLREALEVDEQLRVLLVLREEYLAQLEPYGPGLPGGLKMRFRLERLDRGGALAAVTRPLEGTGRSFASGVGESLVDDLLRLRVDTGAGESVEVPGEFVEPVHLQVVCSRLWAELPTDVTEVRAEHIQALADLDTVLARFYEGALAAAHGEARVPEKRLRRWVRDELITPGGTRSTVYRGRDETAGLPNAAVEALEGKRLVRAEQRAGALWYELTHDRLIGPIRKANARYFAVRARTLRRRAAGAAIFALLALVAGLLVQSRGGGPPATGGAPVPATLVPPRLDFGVTSDPSPSPPQRLTFGSGSEARRLRVLPNDKDDFLVFNGCASNLAAAATCEVEVRFAPSVLGVQRDTVQVLVQGSRPLQASLVGSLKAVRCGLERWAVKTLQDPEARLVSTVPRQTTIAALRRLRAPPPTLAGRHAPVELSTFRVRARLLAMKLEQDNDVHVTVADPETGGTMIVEFPAPTCALGAPAPLQARMQAARQALAEDCGTPSQGGDYTRLQGTATIEGVGFFDSVHGQTGVAPNGIELHPVLAFNADECGTTSPFGPPP